MKNFLSNTITGFTLIIFSMCAYSATAKPYNTRNISIAGLVFDSKNLLPIQSANIFDSGGEKLGTTDVNGYFKINIGYQKAGEIKFKLKIEKQGYRVFFDSEHWGDLRNNPKEIMFFGLRGLNSNAETFSMLNSLPFTGDDLIYKNVLVKFNAVKAQKEFNDKLAEAKAGNENVLVRIDDKYYIVDRTGWIHINSPTDSVLLNGRKTLTADKLNGTLKRSVIKAMTPLDSKNVPFGIYTESHNNN